MNRPHLTARARLTLLYTALFAAGGAVLVAITYLLVAHNPRVTTTSRTTVLDPRFLATCAQAKQDTSANADNLRIKCAAAFQQGVKAGAQAQGDTTLNHLLVYSLTTLLAVTALAAVAGWLLAGRILRPVHQLTAAARAASEHTLSHRLALTGPRDELRELADTFDDMLDRLDAAFVSQRRFIANASHELRTPLTVMRTTLDVVLAKPTPTSAELTAMGTDVRQAVDHAEALIDALLTLARNERGLTVHEPVDLATIAEDVLDTTPADGLRISATLQPATLTGDPLLIERLIVNLIDNAIRYNRPDGDVSISTAQTEDTAVLDVTNSGPVVPPELIDSLFEPFTRLDQRTGRDGFGLGLALVASITDIHNAKVTTTAPPAGGLHVSIRWPKS